MRISLRFEVLAAAILAVALIGGCGTVLVGTSVTYSYEPRYGFSDLKSYRWAEPTTKYGGDPLLEANVRFQADRVLEAKGLTSNADKPRLVMSMRYEFGYGYGYGYSYDYDLRSLTLNVSRADNGELVWRGTATGAIRTDAASGDLTKVVAEILANFPPK